jgi:hypothetical protein
METVSPSTCRTFRSEIVFCPTDRSLRLEAILPIPQVPASHLLISFCGGVTPRAARLGLIDLHSGEFRIVRLPDYIPEGEGFTGLTSDDYFIYAMLPCYAAIRGGSARRRSELLVLDRRDLSVVFFGKLSSVVEAHAVLPTDGSLLIVSSGTDQVFEVKFHNRQPAAEHCIWQADQESVRVDRHHLSGIGRWNGDLLVCGFGLRHQDELDPLWNSARRGFLRNLTTGEDLEDQLHHPHTVLSAGNDLILCESLSEVVRAVNDERVCKLEGYPRGLCAVGNHVYAATSIRRRASRSTGQIVPLEAAGNPLGLCAVYQLDRTTFETQQVWDLSLYGDEIFDLVPIVAEESWPVLSDVQQREAAIVHLNQRLGFELRLTRHAQSAAADLAVVESELRQQVIAQEAIAAELRTQLARQIEVNRQLKHALGTSDESEVSEQTRAPDDKSQ